MYDPRAPRCVLQVEDDPSDEGAHADMYEPEDEPPTIEEMNAFFDAVMAM